MKAGRRPPSKRDMTTPKTLPEQLLDAAENIHSRGTVICAGLMRAAAALALPASRRCSTTRPSPTSPATTSSS